VPETAGGRAFEDSCHLELGQSLPSPATNEETEQKDRFGVG
jgi:hypothetical protein